MIVHKQDLTTCNNARITISYKGKKPNIEFGYPVKAKRSIEVYILSYLWHLNLIGTGIGFLIMYSIQDFNPIIILIALGINFIVLRLTLGIWIKRRFQNLAIWETMVLGGAFYSKRWIEVPKSKIIEIPLFNNIKLDYAAKGEFSKHLDRLEIREHPFKAHEVRFFSGKRIRRNAQQYLWNAKFYFNEVPKNGSLEVFWK